MIVGLTNINNLDFPFAFLRLLKNHFIIGILDRKGTPVPVSEISLFSNPPNTIISSLSILMLELKVRLTCGGGASVCNCPIKSD